MKLPTAVAYHFALALARISPKSFASSKVLIKEAKAFRSEIADKVEGFAEATVDFFRKRDALIKEKGLEGKLKDPAKFAAFMEENLPEEMKKLKEMGDEEIEIELPNYFASWIRLNWEKNFLQLLDERLGFEAMERLMEALEIP